MWSALTGNKLVSALVPRPPLNLNVLNIPFPLEGGRLKGKMPYKFQKCTDRGGGRGQGADCPRGVEQGYLG